MTQVPPEYIRTVSQVCGPHGEAWLERLPALVADLEWRWAFTAGAPFELSYNYVTAAQRADGSQAVLKLCLPGSGWESESAALSAFAGRGCARLLEVDSHEGALLIERVLPGHALAAMGDDDQATRIAAQVMPRLWRAPPAGHSFPSVDDWFSSLDDMRRQCIECTGPIPAALVDQAARLYADLRLAAADAALLHGDLHHGNILAGQREPWLAIDPKGVVGDPAFEPSALLLNPVQRVCGHPDLPALLARRIGILSEHLAIDRARLAAWGLARAVLSAWWHVEDHGHPSTASTASTASAASAAALAVAQALRPLN